MYMITPNHVHFGAMTMSKFMQLSLGSDAQTLGRALIAFFDCINADEILPVLEKHGFEKLEPEQWYSANTFLQIMDELAELPGVTDNLVSIGMKISENAVYPPEFAQMPLPKILGVANTGYQMNNRGKDIGWMRAEVIDDRHIKIHCRIPWPDDFMYGSLYGNVRRFAPKGTRFTLKYEDPKKRRDNGSEETVYDLTW
jgi:hypothetical protein